MEQKLKRNILKSRPYFEEKAVCESSLAAQKQRMNELQTAISKAKAQYAASLRALEAISEEIHRQRREKLEVQLFNFALLKNKLLLSYSIPWGGHIQSAPARLLHLSEGHTLNKVTNFYIWYKITL